MKGVSSKKLTEELLKTLKILLARYDEYSRYLDYPGDWGERAFRGWAVFEIFHSCLGWPIKNIVFGEKYDILMVDDNIKPVVYLETKKPLRGLADLEDFEKRISSYQTLAYAILTDGYEWLKLDIVKKAKSKIKLEDNFSKWVTFVKPLIASNFLYGVD